MLLHVCMQDMPSRCTNVCLTESGAISDNNYCIFIVNYVYQHFTDLDNFICITNVMYICRYYTHTNSE